MEGIPIGQFLIFHFANKSIYFYHPVAELPEKQCQIIICNRSYNNNIFIVKIIIAKRLLSSMSLIFMEIFLLFTVSSKRLCFS